MNHQNKAVCWRLRCNERVEILKAKDNFPNSDDPPSQQLELQEEEVSWERNSVMLHLQNAVQYGDVDRFVHVLEQLSSESKLPLVSMIDQVTPVGDSLLHELGCLLWKRKYCRIDKPSLSPDSDQHKHLW